MSSVGVQDRPADRGVLDATHGKLLPRRLSLLTKSCLPSSAGPTRQCREVNPRHADGGGWAAGTVGQVFTIKHQVSAVLPDCDLTWVRGYVASVRDEVDRLQFDAQGWMQDPESGELEVGCQLLQGQHAQTGALYQIRVSDPFEEDESLPEVADEALPEAVEASPPDLAEAVPRQADDEVPRPSLLIALLVTRRIGDRFELQVNEPDPSKRVWQADLQADLANLSARGKATSPLRQLFPIEDFPGVGLLLSGRVDAEVDLTASPLVQRYAGRLANFKLRSRKLNVDASLNSHRTMAGTRLTLDLKLAGKGLGRLAIAVFRRQIISAVEEGLGEEGFSDKALAEVAAQCDKLGVEMRAEFEARESGEAARGDEPQAL